MHERDKDEIRYHLDTLLSATMDRDWAKASHGHAPNWCGFLPNTREIIRSNQALTVDVMSLLEGKELVDYEMVEIDYVFHGTTCLVPFVARLRARSDTSNVFEVQVGALCVYVLTDGNWLQVAGSASLHPDTQADPVLAADILSRRGTP
jgi:hypothetical protein